MVINNRIFSNKPEMLKIGLFRYQISFYSLMSDNFNTSALMEVKNSSLELH